MRQIFKVFQLKLDIRESGGLLLRDGLDPIT